VTLKKGLLTYTQKKVKVGKLLPCLCTVQNGWKERDWKMMDGLKIQLHTRIYKNTSNSIDPSLGFGPIRRINGVSNSGEIRLVVA